MTHRKPVRLSHNYSAVLLTPKPPCRNISAQKYFYLKASQIVIFTPEKGLQDHLVTNILIDTFKYLNNNIYDRTQRQKATLKYFVKLTWKVEV